MTFVVKHSFSAKSQGEWAEVCFLLRATECGLIVCRPFGDAKYDFVLDNGRRLYRVQIKSVSVPDRRQSGYRISSGFGGSSRQAYTACEIDFLAAYIIPQGIWYILPVTAFAPIKTLRFPPQTPASAVRGNPVLRTYSVRFEAFREAWELLM